MKETRSKPNARSVAFVALLMLSVAVAWSLLPVTGPVDVDAAHSAEGITFHPITIMPLPITIFPIDPSKVVVIPDVNLNKALHVKCGIDMADPIRRGDLYALTGSLSLSGKDIADLEGIQFCRNISSLNVSGNPLSSLPVMSGMTSLQTLTMNFCEFEEIPPEVGDIPNLASLLMVDNHLTEIPVFVAGIATLKTLYLDENEIRTIPVEFNCCHLVNLLLRKNRLSSLPKELFSATSLKTLLVSINRLTSLPEELANKNWTALDVEFNFLDVAAGSETRDLLDSVTATTLAFERQLTPLRDLAAEPGTNEIRLTWTACTDASGPGWSVNVTRYIVYLNEGGTLTELATPDKNTTEYVDAGLSPLLERSYTVGVEYHVDDGALEDITRHYDTVSATTLEAVTPQPSITVEPTAEGTPQPTAETTEAPTGEPTVKPTGGPGTKDSSGLPSWVFIIGGVLLLSIAGTVVALTFVLKAKKPKV